MFWQYNLNVLTGSSETLLPSILNSSIFVQFAKDAGTAESWLYLLKKKDFLLEVNISFHPIYSTSRWLYLASSWLSVVIFCNTLYHPISQWSWSLLSWKAPSKNNRTFFFHTYCYWHCSKTMLFMALSALSNKIQFYSFASIHAVCSHFFKDK